MTERTNDDGENANSGNAVVDTATRADLYLHILYMKSEEKTLTRNFNAHELELFCHNRFYGPLVVAFNNAR